MRPALGLLAISLCAVTAHAEIAKAPPTPKATDPAALTERATMLAPIQIDSLTLTPIVAKGGKAIGAELDVLTLDEAMASKKVRIKERSSETVNHLTLINKSQQPLFLLAGEVIIGGKQDRIIGQNTVIPAKTTQVVPVFCVEHGRWDNSSKEFKSAKALAHGRLRGKASFANQGEVWKEVAAKNAKRKTRNATQTYRQVAAQQTNGALKSWQKRVDAALAKIPASDRNRMIGYVIALNGKVATVDMFQSPSLFKKLEGKLVKSYVTEAIDIAAAKNIKPPTAVDVKAFMADADKAEEKQSFDNARSTTMTKSGFRAGKSSIKLKARPRAGQPAPAADPEAPSVYENYQAK